ncbi:MAG: 3-phosphoshikimate 1-carboxyvinyltransferase [Deltaproteobacteria bacterium]|nr:3-phosphoshikimate 1-carboxyvinyltransferase [Deltaproteobacteria bacterium]
MIEIKPVEKLDAAVRVPGSKSYSQRALVCAALAEGKSNLRDLLISQDTRIMMEALGMMGIKINAEKTGVTVEGGRGRVTQAAGDIFLGNNGTALRLLMGLAALGEGAFVLTGSPRLCERPVGPMLDALKGLGVAARSLGKDGHPPVMIEASGLPGGKAVFGDIESSQYISSLLLSAPYAGREVTVELKGRVPSLPYVDMTIEVMKTFGAEVHREGSCFRVERGKPYRGREYTVEGDLSSASYFFLAAALCGGRVRVEAVNARSLQGDVGIVGIMERLGCRAVKGADYIELTGGAMVPGDLVFNLADMPDMVPTLAVLSALRPGRTAITGVAHLRAKESDRLAALAAELRKTFVDARELPDGLVIEGGSPRGAEIETYDDHRLAMSFAILGLVAPGMKIQGEGCVGKSFPGFWETLKGLY